MPDLPWFVYAFPLLMVGVVAFAVAYKYLEVRQAATWPQTTGRVVVSTSERRKVKTADSDSDGEEEVRNFAKITYEYQVSGQKLRASRVTIGEDLGNLEVEETIARYPLGKIVTVYYNPRRPKQAVLERELPPGIFGCAIWGIVISVVGIFATFFGFNQLAEYVRQFMVNPQHTAIVVGLAAMGTVALLFGFALHRIGNEARRWPKVTGRIVKSELDEYEGRLDPNDAMKTLYRPLISYAYEYNGITYHGDQVSLGAKITANREAFASKLIAKYPLGSTIEVYVNPKNASQAVLQPAPAHAWIVWVAAAVLLGGAIFIARQP
jgi:hypothetical protein